MSSRNEPHETQLSEELAALERQLASYAPAPARIDRDRLMYAAGAASVAGALDAPRVIRSPWWPVTSAAAAVVACVFASLYALERSRGPETIREVVYVEREAPAVSQIVEATAPREFNASNAIRPPIFLTAPWPAAPAGVSNYLTLRHRVLTHGVDSLPQPTYDGDSTTTNPVREPATNRSLLNEFLPPTA